MTSNLAMSQPLPFTTPMIEGGRMAEPETGRGRASGADNTSATPGTTPIANTRRWPVVTHVPTPGRAVSPRHMARPT
jgi:hypothetical protein